MYKEFGLKHGSTGQVMGLGVWWRGFKATILKGHLPEKPIANIFQLPGAFLLADGAIVRSYEYASSADRPDYVDLATCDLPSPLED